MSRKSHFDKDKSSHRRYESHSRSRDRDASKEREKALQVAVYQERTPSKFITEELGNQLTDFSLRQTIRDKLNRAKNEERKKEEKIQFNFTKKKEDHSDTLTKHKLIEAIENPNPDSLEHVTKLTKFNKELDHLNAMFSNDHAKDKKKTDNKAKANAKNKKESNDDFDINDEDLLKTFG